jgi:hypothetical protein
MKGKIDPLKIVIQKYRVFTGWREDFLGGQNVINASVFPPLTKDQKQGNLLFPFYHCF